MSEQFYKNVINVLRVLTFPLIKTNITGHEFTQGKTGYILALNHISQLDPILVGVAFKDTHIHALAKASLFRTPIIGTVLKKMGHIPVDRGTQNAGGSLKHAVTSLKSGKIVGIYPEGTIPPTGQLGEFKTGAARLSLETGCPIVPVGQYGAQVVVPIKISVWKIVKTFFGKRVPHYMVLGEPIYPTQVQHVPEENKAQELTKILKKEIGLLEVDAKTRFLWKV